MSEKEEQPTHSKWRPFAAPLWPVFLANDDCRRELRRELIRTTLRPRLILAFLGISCALGLIAGLAGRLLGAGYVCWIQRGSGALMGGLTAGVLSRRWLRARTDVLRRHPELCQRCGYNLTGNSSGKCPECGAEIPVTRADVPSAADIRPDATSSSE